MARAAAGGALATVPGVLDPGVRTVALLAGPLVLLGYLLGSVPFALAWRRWRLRVELDRGPAALGRLASGRRGPVGRQGEAVVVVFEAAAALLAAHLGWVAIAAVAPGGGPNPFAASSTVAVFSAQALTAWQSVALWAGFAAVLGHVAPVWTRWRGGTGLPPVVALCAVHLPWVFVGGLTGFFCGVAATRRRRIGVLAAVPAALVVAWATWVLDVNPAWGMRSGAEPALWVLMTGLVIVVRASLGPEPEPTEGR